MDLKAAQFMGALVDVEIDRPLGSKHPEHDLIYPVNYGYVPGTLAADGEPLDVYILGVAEPLLKFRGRCVAVIHRLDDDDDKLVVIPSGATITAGQIRSDTRFQEQFFKSIIVCEKPA